MLYYSHIRHKNMERMQFIIAKSHVRRPPSILLVLLCLRSLVVAHAVRDKQLAVAQILRVHAVRGSFLAGSGPRLLVSRYDVSIRVLTFLAAASKCALAACTRF